MAIFKRKNSRSLLEHTQESVWPSMGWIRTFHYYRHRIFRDGSSAYKITAGLALGMAISFSPFIGTHFLQVAALAPVIRANMIAGFVGTIFGNPWTFPFLFMMGYKVGIVLCGVFGMGEFLALPAFMDMQYFIEKPFEFLSYLFANPLKLLLPMVVGGYVCALLFWAVAFAALYQPVKIARLIYIRSRRRKSRRKHKGNKK